jgi:hypothetical protein
MRLLILSARSCCSIEVFDFPHEEIAKLVSRSPAACRKLLERARQRVAEGRRLITASREEHERLLQAFLRAASAGDVAALTDLLAADAVLITDGGPEGREFRGIRNLRRPLEGARRVAAFVAATSRRAPFRAEQRDLNGDRRWSSTAMIAPSRPSCSPWPKARSNASSSTPIPLGSSIWGAPSPVECSADTLTFHEPRPSLGPLNQLTSRSESSNRRAAATRSSRRPTGSGHS